MSDLLSRPRLRGGRLSAALCECTEISVRALEVMAQVGVNADEYGRRQLLRLHVALTVRALQGDQIGDTFDYCNVGRYAEALCANHIPLIEVFAERLARNCLAHACVQRADVIVEKPSALESGLASARVVLRRG